MKKHLLLLAGLLIGKAHAQELATTRYVRYDRIPLQEVPGNGQDALSQIDAGDSVQVLRVQPGAVPHVPEFTTKQYVYVRHAAQQGWIMRMALVGSRDSVTVRKAALATKKPSGSLQKRGIAYVNATSLNLRQTPSVTGTIVCQLHAAAGIYVEKPFEAKYNTPEIRQKWAYVEWPLDLEGMIFTGFVERKFLVSTSDSVTVPASGEEITLVQKMPGMSVVSNRVTVPGSRNVPFPTVQKRTVGRAAGSRQYYTGPRGGCYYLNASGKKEYVDRSLCN